MDSGISRAHPLSDKVFGNDPVEGPFVEDDGLTIDGNDLGLVPVRQGVGLEMCPDVEDNQLDPLVMLGQGVDVDALPLDPFPRGLVLIGKPVIEDNIELFGFEVPALRAV